MLMIYKNETCFCMQVFFIIILITILNSRVPTVNVYVFTIETQYNYHKSSKNKTLCYH